MMKKLNLSVVIITRNEGKMIKNCLSSAENFAEEIILVDNGSTDNTVTVARKYGAKIIHYTDHKKDFSYLRNTGLKAAKNDWIFYLDADERITPGLKKEILSVTDSPEWASAFAVPRRNFWLGKRVRYGGAWPDYVIRLFRKDKLKRWEGRLHEQPVFEGKLVHLAEPMIHITHRDLSSMLEKTKEWSKVEAELLFEAHHPPVTWWRFSRIMATEFWKRAIKLQGWRDGAVGWIEIIFQMFSRFVTYARLWEMQQRK
jgi:glycosyltransferase involved in cell wall biosynthesis